MKRKIILKGKQTEVLQVPYYTQEQTEAWCIPYSLKMCIEFFKEYYRFSVIRNQIKTPQVEKIAKIMKADRENGTKITTSILSDLETQTVMLNYKLTKHQNYSILEKRFNDDLPTIVLYDLTYLMNKERGPGHAAVVIGLTKEYIILNNPWKKGEWPVEKMLFDEGWELEYRSILQVDPKQPIPKLEEVDKYI